MSAATATGWTGRPLGQVADTKSPEPTVGAGYIVYPGARHIFMGEPESGKTIAVYAIALEELRSRPVGWVALVDFEMGPELACRRFREMGATDQELDRIVCFTPDTAPRPGEVADVLLGRDDTPEPNPLLVVYDSWAGASALLGLDDNKRADIETFAAVYIVPLWSNGITTIVLDHVTKSREGRARWAIGSERKLGVVDVALGFEVIHQMSRGNEGLLRVVASKDRFGYLSRPTAVMIEVHSDPDTHAITWTWKPPAASERSEDGFRPTVLMGRVSAFLEKQTEPVSLRTIENAGLGKSREWIRKAVEALAAEGYVTETPGPRRARMFSFERQFTTSPEFAATSPGEVGATSPHFAYPLQGGEVRGEVNGAKSPDDLSGEVERLAAKYPEESA